MRLTVIPIHPYGPAHHARLKSLAETHNLTVNYHDLPMGDPAILEKIQGTELLIITPRLPFDILPALERCKLISLESTGVDMIDLDRAKASGIQVVNVPDYSSRDVAERIFALLLNLTHHVQEGHATVTGGTWDSPTSQISVALQVKTMGIFGMGKIGQRVADLARAFGMNVISHTAHPDEERGQNLTWVDFDELLTQSDVIVLTAPATSKNRDIFNADAFARMKNTAFFINTARGALVDESALAHALKTHQIAGAGVDVFQQEPVNRNNPLLISPNVILSPHTAFASDVSLDRLHTVALDNVETFLTQATRGCA